MKRKSPLVRQSSETDINNAMTPMIDVVFLLLVFFVWTASFQVIEFVMPPSEMSAQMGSEQKQQDEPPPKDIQDIVVRIRWTPSNQVVWSVDNQNLDSIEDVTQRLTQMADVVLDGPAGDSEVVVIIHPDKQVPLGHVIETYDAGLVAGFSKMSFAVNR